MAQFNYKAVDANGKAKKGTIDAADREKAMDKLKEENKELQMKIVQLETEIKNNNKN